MHGAQRERGKALRKAKTVLQAKVALGRPEEELAAARERVRHAEELLAEAERDSAQAQQKIEEMEMAGGA